jgi:hypothetical protein
MAIDVDREEFSSLASDLHNLSQSGGGLVTRNEYASNSGILEDKDIELTRDVDTLQAQVAKMRKTLNAIVLQDQQDFVPTKEQRADYDSVNLQYIYKGTALKNSTTYQAVWKISRYDFNSGTVKYAEGTENYDKIYDDRESLTYT